MYRKERKSMTQSKSATYRQVLLKLAAIITAGPEKESQAMSDLLQIKTQKQYRKSNRY